MGISEILWSAAALLAVYVAIRLYQALRSRLRRPRGARRHPASADGASGDEEVFVFERPPPSSRRDGFQVELEVQQLRRDVAQLRAELAEQRREVASLTARLQVQQAQQEQFDGGVAKAGASPEYDEALVFARRGLDVEAIAERCGITVAEAALVRALAQERKHP
ncbi:DUF2802 domain-containing protein [Aromatoleum bremense]|uniref:DUF2802 domain-containing protein n=1 Tax=Aromatoleum bremense TaxID=76115 RepID=A0ABX1NU81_9RHOO|nr:DUF2802 domain-containing protein [Aromatoleum bremense]NMG15110.1 DUF2802 domain-containing protein [Aromatoleum bremense]QTQ31478.1 putative protein DUf2802 [Aromatoleum bremense]